MILCLHWIVLILSTNIVISRFQICSIVLSFLQQPWKTGQLYYPHIADGRAKAEREQHDLLKYNTFNDFMTEAWFFWTSWVAAQYFSPHGSTSSCSSFMECYKNVKRTLLDKTSSVTMLQRRLPRPSPKRSHKAAQLPGQRPHVLRHITTVTPHPLTYRSPDDRRRRLPQEDLSREETAEAESRLHPAPGCLAPG